MAGAPVQHQLSTRTSGGLLEKQLLCVSKQQPFSSIKRVQCSPKGSQCNPLSALPGAATLRLRSVKGRRKAVAAAQMGKGGMC